MKQLLKPLAALMIVAGSFGEAGEPRATDSRLSPPAPDEPLIGQFSLAAAARSLDAIALDWQQNERCAACHTMSPYLMARPSLNSVSPEPPEVRRFFETIVEQRLEAEPDLPPDGISAIIVQTAAALAFHDRTTTGKLHPLTRQQLDRMWTLQRENGSWEWPFRDVPPIKSDEHYGVTMAVLAAGVAPEDYASSDAANAGLARVRRFLAAHPPYSLHQKAMLLWGGAYVDDLISVSDSERFVDELCAAQRPDGGWSLASLIENPGDPAFQSEVRRQTRAAAGHGSEFLVFVGREATYRSSLESDGYATGLTLYILRQAGLSAEDPRIARGIAWIKSRQRASGRWFTPSQSWSTLHYISNAGSAYCVLALDACGEIP